MNVNEEMKLHKWAQDIAEQKNSGLSQTQWCKMKGIPAPHSNIDAGKYAW